MTAEVQDVIGAHLVLFAVHLFRKREEFEAFRSTAGVDVTVAQRVRQTAPGGNVQQALTFTLPKERITLNVDSDGTKITRDYPTSQEELKRLVEVAQLAIEKSDLSDQIPHSFGVTIELVLEQDSEETAAQYLANRLFAPGLKSLGEGWPLSGGESVLEYTMASRQRYAAVEPHDDDSDTSKVYLRFSEHVTEERVPSHDEMFKSLVDTWDNAQDFVHRLDKKL